MNYIRWQSFLLSLTLAGSLTLSCFGNVAASTDTKADVFLGTDLPVVVPQNLTSQEYYDLARQYDWSRPRQALECIAKIEKQNPGSPLALAATRFKDTVLPKVIPPAEAIELASKVQNAWQSRGNPAVWRISARKFANECIAKYPNFEYGYMSLANLEALDDKRDLAAEAFRHALRINPHNAQAWDGLGDQLLSLHQIKEAKSAFQQALSYEHADTLAQNRLDNMSEYEKSPPSLLENFFSTAIGLFTLPAALMARDQEALKTSGFIDKNGKFAFHQLNSGPVPDFSDGLLLVWDHFLDKHGNKVGDQKFSAAKNFSEGLAAVSYKNEWGYLSTSGNYAITPQFQAAKSFHEGLAPAKSGGRWGFLDKSGKWAVRPQFAGALPFSDGLAAVVLGGKVGYIDRQGKLIIPAQFDAALSFSDGLALVTTYETAILRHHQRCINTKGKVLFDLTQLKQSVENKRQSPQQYSSSGRIRNDLLVTEVSQFEGSPACFTEDYDNPQRFSDGLMLIQCGAKYGYVDKSGHFAIACQFGSATPFKEGLACVSLDSSNLNVLHKNNQTFGYIDKTGKFAIKPRFESAAQFSEGLAFVRDKQKAGFIDHAGQIVLEVPSGTGGAFHDGLARVGEPVVYP